MTASPPLPRERDVSGESVISEERPGCAVCEHDPTDHDAIALRYCQATQAQALPRRCICRAQ